MLPVIAGPDGPLSPAAARALVERLDAASRGGGLLRAHLSNVAALQGNAPLMLGNRAELLVDGPATLDSMTQAVAGARSTINLETYRFADDALGRRFAELLMRRQREGVQVNVIYDSFGSLATPSALFERMRASGIRVIEYNPLDPLRATAGWKPGDRDHRKLLVVDGRTVFTGGVNLSGVYASGSFARSGRNARLPWRDTEVKITGPVASEFQQLFLSEWTRLGGPPLSGSGYFPRLEVRGAELVRAVSSASGGEPDRVYLTLMSAIRSARRSVHVTTAYFAPDPQLLRALMDAARRGIDVTLLLPGRTDIWPTMYAARSYYDELLSAGVKIYERRHALLHAKTAVVDGVWTTIGSTNLDWLSLSQNAEVNAVLVGTGFAAQMEALFHADLHRSERIKLEGWRRRSFAERFKEWVARLGARLM